MNPNQQSPSRPVRALYNRNCGLRTEWLGSSFQGQSEAGHSGRGRHYVPGVIAIVRQLMRSRELQRKASPDLKALRAPHLHSSTQSGGVFCGLLSKNMSL
ncbi:UNVERIFIED_CONTAM: hypothetical protein FKN15_018821 [Acipenser sinensis]